MNHSHKDNQWCEPQGKPWTLFSDASLGESNHPLVPSRLSRDEIGIDNFLFFYYYLKSLQEHCTSQCNVWKAGELMSTKGTRSGGKYTGSHTTIIPEASSILDDIAQMDFVKKISLGIIKSGNRRGGSHLRIHCRPLNDDVHGLRVTLAKGGLLQVVRVYLMGSARIDYTIGKIEKLNPEGGKKKKKRT